MNAVEYYQNYIAHFGTKGQQWGKRHFQSYETAPTRSGMVGEELGEAAKQSERKLSKEEKQEAKAEQWRQKEIAKVKKTFDEENQYRDYDWLKKWNEYGDEIKAHGHSKKSVDLMQKALDSSIKQSHARSRREAAIQSIKNMSIKDIKKERAQRAADVLLSSGLAGAVTALGALSGNPAGITVGAIAGSNAAAIYGANRRGLREEKRMSKAYDEYMSKFNTKFSDDDPRKKFKKDYI